MQQYRFELAVTYKLAQYRIAPALEGYKIEFIVLEGIDSQSSLAEAYDKLKDQRSGAVYVYDTDPDTILGVLTWDNVQAYLHQGQI